MPPVGALVRTAAGAWITQAPSHCPKGHRIGGGQVLVGHLACGEHPGGHTTWTCRACDQTVYGPDLDWHCTVLAGPAEVRISTRRSSSS